MLKKNLFLVFGAVCLLTGSAFADPNLIVKVANKSIFQPGIRVVGTITYNNRGYRTKALTNSQGQAELRFKLPAESKGSGLLTLAAEFKLNDRLYKAQVIDQFQIDTLPASLPSAQSFYTLSYR
jgi:hypothetical protein